MKTIFYSIVAIWFTGAGVTTLIYEFDRKADCVKNEGAIKGMLWCDTDATTQFGIGVSHISMFIKGLLWPINIYTIFTKQEGNLSNKSPKEKLAAFENAIKECRYERTNPTEQAKNCVQQRIDYAYGARTPGEGFCIRESNAYLAFAQGRDSGATLVDGLNYIENNTSQVSSKLTEPFGMRLDEGRMKNDLKDVMYYVYSHPDMSAQDIRKLKFSECMATVKQ